MKATLCIIGLTLLCTTLAEGTTLHLKTRKHLKKPFTGAQRNQNLETHLGKIIHNIFLEKKNFSVSHHFDYDDCTQECGFELQLTMELCKIGAGTLQIPDEGTFRDCLENHFDSVGKNSNILANAI